MVDIRPLEHSDVAAVASLLRSELPGWVLDERILAASVLDHPWYDAETPSLVATDGSAIVGFVGVQARRMHHGERPMRGACFTQLAVASSHRTGALGMTLLKRILAGPQEVTWSDSSTDVVLRIWQAFGGHLDSARAADFMLVLRPLRWIADVARAKAGRRGIGRTMVPVKALPLSGHSTGRSGTGLPDGVEGRAAGAAEVAARIGEFTTHLTVSVDWDEAELSHVLRQVEAFEGEVSCRMVRRGDREIGWYAYVRRPGKVSRLLHLSAVKKAVDDVFAELVADATAGGSAVLAGRAEPHLEASLRRREATLGFVRQPTIRARDPELAAALSTSATLLTRLEGEVFAA